MGRPVGVLGQVVKERTLHSVASAAFEIDVWNELLDRVLTDKGGSPKTTNGRPHARRLMPSVSKIHFKDLCITTRFPDLV
jgi:hypothetical protein